MNKPLPIGVDDFSDLISNGYYYIDKTLFVKELLDKKGKVNLFTRPRRFGKTLGISMLKYFFENTHDEQKNAANKHLFDEMQIMASGDRYLSEMNRYPVISLTLKSAKQPTWNLAYACLKEAIENEFQRHKLIKSAISVEADREKFENIVQRKGASEDYVTALAFLSKCLEEAYGQKAIILIDEYDVPLENAYFNGFYDRMVFFIRSLFESALKTNPSLYFAVITGCLRITKESIFTGLNNLKMNSILSGTYGEYFGFTPDEVKNMLQYYGVGDAFDTAKKWYDGYLFGRAEVYNPWSIINYTESLRDNPEEFPVPYWSNTSSNNIIRSLIDKADLSVREEIERLIAGGTIVKSVHEDITYEDIYSTMDNLWNFLFFTGYLKNNGKHMEGNRLYVELSIPNTEILEIYKDKVLGWFNEKIEQRDLSGIYRDMINGNVSDFQDGLTELLQDTISFYDNVEYFYHGFMIGFLGGLKTHIVQSNRESGDGRYDITIRSLQVSRPLILMELKFAEDYLSMEKEADDALDQIEKKSYDREFRKEGYKKSIRYGISFYKKNCLIKKEEVEL